ncbi:hypothetical protein L1987_42487 [Smallanthus sonchifolius]|uniref:Uncharacterized protein n=1 Tax=Smallanthus sonchifolius TaxID=185202 RepID=A0ACB9GJZ0_9ASTR|nr:hypothetical protein L1987_42487 [Smallanthus sonchifolius]
MAIERMFGMVTDIQRNMNISQDISWDDLFDYSGFHRDVGGGEGSSGENVQEGGQGRDEDDVDSDDKNGEPKRKDDKDQGCGGGSGAGLEDFDNSDTDGGDDDNEDR